MKETEYIVDLDTEGLNRLRVRFISERGKISRFILQYEAYIGGNWHKVVRYDTAHRRAHMHRFKPDGSADQFVLDLSGYNEAYTYAHADLKARWQWYRLQYEEALEL